MRYINLIKNVKKYDSFVITSHVNLEGDALGSELAFLSLLKSLGKKAVIVNDDDLPYGFEFLPQIKSIVKYSPKLKNLDFDCLVVLDCSDLNRTGDAYKVNKLNKPIINVDHHISNSYFGSVNLVEPHASSCCEIIFKLFKAAKVPYKYESAIALYVGIMTDTGSFHYSNTSSFTFYAASELVKCGLNVQQIYRMIYEDKPFKDLMILAGILSSVKLANKGRVAWVVLNKNHTSNKNLSFDLSEKILSFCRSIKGVEVAVLFKEIETFVPQVKVNFRSQGKVDVNKVAKFFEGGGHKTASGCTINSTLISAKRAVFNKIAKEL